MSLSNFGWVSVRLCSVTNTTTETLKLFSGFFFVYLRSCIGQTQVCQPANQPNHIGFEEIQTTADHGHAGCQLIQ